MVPWFGKSARKKRAILCLNIYTGLYMIGLGAVEIFCKTLNFLIKNHAHLEPLIILGALVYHQTIHILI